MAEKDTIDPERDAEGAGIRGAREDAARREPPFPGDGTNTGETTPEPGPEPGVTETIRELDPGVVADAGMRDVPTGSPPAEETGAPAAQGERQERAQRATPRGGDRDKRKR
jgi:hypothetical protein